jgi:hypothetical protein
MRKALKPLVIALPILAICGITWLVLEWAATEKLRRSYEGIKKGDSETQVLKSLGAPSKISGSPVNISWDSDETVHPNKGECVREFRYVPPVSVAGEEFSIGFDTRSNVISKYRYESP